MAHGYAQLLCYHIDLIGSKMLQQLLIPSEGAPHIKAVAIGACLIAATATTCDSPRPLSLEPIAPTTEPVYKGPLSKHKGGPNRRFTDRHP
jgi:hypothetical protein